MITVEENPISYRHVVAFTLPGGLVAGCASEPPTFADRVMAEGQSRVEIARQWEKGSDEASRGEERVKAGRRLLDEGRAELREGEKLIASGNVAVRNSREAYRSLSLASEATVTVRDADRRNERLERVAEEWREGESRIKRGRERVEAANERIEEGESRLRSGQQLIDRGRDLMRSAENRYQRNESQS